MKRFVVHVVDLIIVSVQQGDSMDHGEVQGEGIHVIVSWCTQLGVCVVWLATLGLLFNPRRLAPLTLTTLSGSISYIV